MMMISTSLIYHHNYNLISTMNNYSLINRLLRRGLFRVFFSALFEALVLDKIILEIIMTSVRMIILFYILASILADVVNCQRVDDEFLGELDKAAKSVGSIKTTCSGPNAWLEGKMLYKIYQ